MKIWTPKKKEIVILTSTVIHYPRQKKDIWVNPMIERTLTGWNEKEIKDYE